MLRLTDKRWTKLMGGYRTVFDPRPALRNLKSDVKAKEAWHELWEELHHQGDVGEASYAAVPHIVRIYRRRGGDRWETFGLVALIELAQGQAQNPKVPSWLKRDYFQAIQDLAEIGSAQVMTENDADAVRAMLSVIAIAKGARTHARLMFEYSDEEMSDLEKKLLGS